MATNLLAYICRLCGLQFWITDEAVSELDEQRLNEVLYNKRVSCPCCSSQYDIQRSPNNDIEED